MTVECQKLTCEDYERFKKSTIQNAPESVRDFVRKVFIVIEDVMRK
jgi:hypothetical protein